MDFPTLVAPAGHGVPGYPITRGQQVQAAGPCICSVCEVGRLSGKDYIAFKDSVTEPVGRPSVCPPRKDPEPLLVCSICLSSWGPGQSHVCTRKTKADNMEDLVRSSSDRTREKVISSQLKEVFHAKGIPTRGGTVKLATGSHPLSATLGAPVVKPQPKFTNEALNRLQLKMGASDNKMNIMANFLRINCGRNSVEKVQDHMSARNKKLDDMFDIKYVKQSEYTTTGEVEEGKSNKKRKKEVKEVDLPVVYAKNVEELASLIMVERGLTPETSLVQIGIDDGQNLLKVMMSVKEKDPEPVEPRAKRFKYDDGFAPTDFKLSGVKKLILLLVSPTSERHDNMSALMNLLNLDAIEFGLCCDLKMVNIVLGKQNASSKFCCPFCFGSSPWQGSFTTTTVGILWKEYNSFVAAGSNLKKAMDFHNVVNPPLVTGGDEKKILGDLFFVPEHHVYTGIFGKLVMEFERKSFDTPQEGKDYLDTWMASPGINVSRTVYHGSANFVGNMVQKFLSKLENLEFKVRQDLSPAKLLVAKTYMEAFKLLRAVVKSCFGQTLSPGYSALIKDFSTHYRSLNISIPLKVRNIPDL